MNRSPFSDGGQLRADGKATPPLGWLGLHHPSHDVSIPVTDPGLLPAPQPAPELSPPVRGHFLASAQDKDPRTAATAIPPKSRELRPRPSVAPKAPKRFSSPRPKAFRAPPEWPQCRSVLINRSCSPRARASVFLLVGTFTAHISLPTPPHSFLNSLRTGRLCYTPQGCPQPRWGADGLLPADGG